MLKIAQFYGMLVHIKPSKNAVIYAAYGEYSGCFDIHDFSMNEGNLPQRAQEFVVEWVKLNQLTLQQMWKTQEFKPLPPLE